MDVRISLQINAVAFSRACFPRLAVMFNTFNMWTRGHQETRGLKGITSIVELFQFLISTHVSQNSARDSTMALFPPQTDIPCCVKACVKGNTRVRTVPAFNRSGWLKFVPVKMNDALRFTTNMEKEGRVCPPNIYQYIPYPHILD